MLDPQYWLEKRQFMEYSLCTRVQHPSLNKAFHLVINIFEKELLNYNGELLNWFFDRVMIVIVLFLASSRDYTVLLLTENNWTDKIFDDYLVENFVITTERIPEKCSTLLVFNIILFHEQFPKIGVN